MFDQSSYVAGIGEKRVTHEQRNDMFRRTTPQHLSLLGSNLNRVLPMPTTGSFFDLLEAIDTAERTSLKIDVVRHT